MIYNDFSQLPLVFGVVDVADTLNIGRNKAYELINSGVIKSLKVGNQYRIPKQAFINFLSEGIQIV